MLAGSDSVTRAEDGRILRIAETVSRFVEQLLGPGCRDGVQIAGHSGHGELMVGGEPEWSTRMDRVDTGPDDLVMVVVKVACFRRRTRDATLRRGCDRASARARSGRRPRARPTAGPLAGHPLNPTRTADNGVLHHQPSPRKISTGDAIVLTAKMSFPAHAHLWTCVVGRGVVLLGSLHRQNREHRTAEHRSHGIHPRSPRTGPTRTPPASVSWTRARRFPRLGTINPMTVAKR